MWFRGGHQRNGALMGVGRGVYDGGYGEGVAMKYNG